MKLSQKDIIKRHLADVNDWVPGYKLSSTETSHGWIGSSGERRCRELAEGGEILREKKGKYVYYRTKSPVKVETYKVEGMDKIITKKIYN